MNKTILVIALSLIAAPALAEEPLQSRYGERGLLVGALAGSFLGPKDTKHRVTNAAIGGLTGWVVGSIIGTRQDLHQQGYPAQTYVQQQPVYVQPQPVYVQPQPVYVQPAPVQYYVSPPQGSVVIYSAPEGYSSHGDSHRHSRRHAHGHGRRY